MTDSKWPLNDPGVYVMNGHCDGDTEAIVTTDGRLLVAQDTDSDYSRFADLTELYLSPDSSWTFQKPEKKNQQILLEDVEITITSPDANNVARRALLSPYGERNRWIEAYFGEEATESLTANDEVRSVSSTGAEKGVKLARFDLLPSTALYAVAEHYGRGSGKYADRNWEKGYEWSKSFASLQRHLWAWWGGEDRDPELNSPHLAAAAFHIFALLEFAETHPEFDDRNHHE